MKLIRLPVLVVGAIAVSASCGADDADGSIDYETWCRAYETFTLELRDVMIQPTTPPNLTSEEVQDLNAMGEAFVELPVPEPIADDWLMATPRNPTPPDMQNPVEQSRARAEVFTWIVENCAPSDELEAELQRQIDEDREYLDNTSTTVG